MESKREDTYDVKEESYDDYKDLDELDELDDLESYSLTYQVVIVGFDADDNETEYYRVVAEYEDEESALLKAASIIKYEIKDLSDDEFYVRVNVEAVVVGASFEETQDTKIYSRVILIK